MVGEVIVVTAPCCTFELPWFGDFFMAREPWVRRHYEAQRFAARMGVAIAVLAGLRLGVVMMQ